jgi:uroporphyrinogen-III synthase
VRVIITRPRTEATPWLNAIDASGFSSWSLPLIDVHPTPLAQGVESAWSRLGSFDAVMFVSRNAAQHFFVRKPLITPAFCAQAAMKTVAFATGPGSFSTLRRMGAEPEFIVSPDLEAGKFDSEALWEVVRGRVVPGYRVLIVRGSTVGAGQSPSPDGSGRDWFAQQVREAGGEVEFVVSYERSCPEWDAGTTRQAEGASHDGSVWVFSSSEAIRNLQQCCAGTGWSRARAVVTHHRIGAAARAAGFGQVLESKPLLPALLASIESLQ